jgi:hypothetical protein
MCAAPSVLTLQLTDVCAGGVKPNAAQRQADVG